MQRKQQLEELETKQEWRQKNQDRSIRQNGLNNTMEKNSKRQSISHNGHRSSVQEFRISIEELSGGKTKLKGVDIFNESKENSVLNSSGDLAKRRRSSNNRTSHLYDHSRSNSPTPESSRQFNCFEEYQRNPDNSRATESSRHLLERENRDLQNSLQFVLNDFLASKSLPPIEMKSLPLRSRG